MKKQMLLPVALATLLMVSVSVNAQQKLSFGLKGGVNSTFYKYDSESPYADSKMKAGGSAGGFLKYDFGKWFAVQTEIMVHYHNSEMKNKYTNEKSDLKSYDLELPVYGVFQFNLGEGKVLLGVGPYVGYGVSAKLDGMDMYKKDFTGKAPMKQLNYGAAAMLGYDFGRFQISTSYISQNGIGVIRKGSALTRQTFELGIGYKL